MSKLKAVLLIVGIALVTNIVQFVVWHQTSAHLEERLRTEIATLNTTLDAIGPIQTVYTVNGTVEAGAEIKAEQIQEMSLPSSMITDVYITDTSSIVGKLYKVGVTSGTPLTTNMIMDREIDDTTRDVDICVDRWTVGLKEGDYVDYRITLPYGDDYIAIPHLRIEAVGTTTLKVYMNETQWQIYQGTLVDYYLHSQQGASIYVSKYVEPGVQKPATAYYAVPNNVKAIMMRDPNIVDKAAVTAMNKMRKSIENILKLFKNETVTTETEAGLLNSGRTNYNSSVNSDASVMTNEEEEKKDEEPYGGDSVFEGEDVVSDGGTVE